MRLLTKKINLRIVSFMRKNKNFLTQLWAFFITQVYQAAQSAAPVGVVIVFKKPDGSYYSLCRDEERRKTFWLDGRIEVFGPDSGAKPPQVLQKSQYREARI